MIVSLRPATPFTRSVWASASNEVLAEQWIGCCDNVTITHYRIADMGHQWPGGEDTVPVDVAATPVIWAFFQAHPVPLPGGRFPSA